MSVQKGGRRFCNFNYIELVFIQKKGNNKGGVDKIVLNCMTSFMNDI
jgi:hypothetical protein